MFMQLVSPELNNLCYRKLGKFYFKHSAVNEAPLSNSLHIFNSIQVRYVTHAVTNNKYLY